MRVLSVQHYPTFGGPYNEILLLDRPLRDLGVETVVVMTDEPGTAQPRLAGITDVRTIPLARIRKSADPRLHVRTMANFRRDISTLRGVIRRERVDLVKVHGPHNPHGAIAAHMEGIPVVWVISSTRVPQAFRRLGVALVRHYAASVLVNGHGLLEAYPGADSLVTRSFAYYPPIDTDVFHPISSSERNAVRDELGIPRDVPLVGTIANVNPQKGISTFVQVASQIQKAFPTSRFVVVGAIAPSQSSYYKQVRAEGERLVGADRLCWLGERTDVSRLVAALDVKVITSVPESEGTTTTAGEAMACEIPVVATRVGAVAEVVDDGKTGFIVAPGDPHAISEQVVRLLADDSMRQTMGEAGRKRVSEHFSVQRCVDTHMSAYEYALANHVKTPATNDGRRHLDYHDVDRANHNSDPQA
jgi:glycosyltransferase involved in cell wall biosynthesis